MKLIDRMVSEFHITRKEALAAIRASLSFPINDTLMGACR